jgi:hypothetical protein
MLYQVSAIRNEEVEKLDPYGIANGSCDQMLYADR